MLLLIISNGYYIKVLMNNDDDWYYNKVLINVNNIVYDYLASWLLFRKKIIE